MRHWFGVMSADELGYEQGAETSFDIGPSIIAAHCAVSESFAGKANDAVPVGRRGAIVQDDLVHQEILGAVAGWHRV